VKQLRGPAESNVPVGLKNLGATCYLNVLIQTLFQNLIVRDAIFNIIASLQRNHNGCIENNEFTVIKALQV